MKIDLDDRQKTRDLSHIGAYHAWVEDSFPREEGKERVRKLWRIDYLNSGTYLLVLSQDRPNVQSFEKYGVEGSCKTKDYSKLINQLREGHRYRFKIKLNPVISLSNEREPGERGRVVPLVKEEDQLDYILKRSKKLGFNLIENEYFITEKGFEKLIRKGQRPINIASATYEGILTVTDLELFKSTLLKGVGKKKAFGFGLLTIMIGEA